MSIENESPKKELDSISKGDYPKIEDIKSKKELFEEENVDEGEDAKSFSVKWSSRISEIFQFLDDLSDFVTKNPSLKFEEKDLKNEYLLEEFWGFENIKKIISNFPENLVQITSTLDEKMKEINKIVNECLELRKNQFPLLIPKEIPTAWFYIELGLFAGQYYNIILAIISNISTELFYECNNYGEQQEELSKLLKNFKNKILLFQT